ARAIAAIVNDVYAEVDATGPWARATFAQFGSEPISPNTVPGVLRCTLDLRHPELAVLDGLEASMRSTVERVAAQTGVKAAVTLENDSPPVSFDPACITAVDEATRELGFTATSMVSGAGHDACYVAEHCPTSMIFVPCDDGLSHNEAESISPEQAERGASVLLGAVRRMAHRN
ncbi:MAG: M20/M25/M40 family metallo-hydrolase, partial [Actinomycetota bacterium]